MKKFFGTDALLVIIADNMSEVFQHYFYWSTKTYDSSKIRYILADAVARMKEQIKKTLEKQLFPQVLLDKYEYILFQQGRGETICFLYWMKEYAKFNSRPVAVFCMQESRRELLELCPFISKVIMGNQQFLAYLSVYYGERFNIKNFDSLYFIRRRPFEIKPEWCIADDVWDFLNLPQGAKLKRYDIAVPNTADKNADMMFGKMHLRKDRTVFIVHNGVNFGDGDRNGEFWKRLVDVLGDNGYDVVFNSQEEVYGCPGIYCPIYETIKFAEKCGGVISISTGLTEAICALSTKPIFVQFVWPGEYDPVWTINEVRCERTLREIKQYGSDFVSGVIAKHRKYEDSVFSESAVCEDYILDMEPEKM